MQRCWNNRVLQELWVPFSSDVKHLPGVQGVFIPQRKKSMRSSSGAGFRGGWVSGLGEDLGVGTRTPHVNGPGVRLCALCVSGPSEEKGAVGPWLEGQVRTEWLFG